VVVDLEPIREGLRRAGADAIWVHPGVDLRHLTGLAPLAMKRPTALVVLADGGSRTLAPAMLAPELAEIEGADLVAWTDGDGPDAAIARVLDGIGRLLVGDALPYAFAAAIRAARPAVELALDPGILAARRERKRPDELELLRAAGRHADAAAAWIAEQPVAGRSERYLALALTIRFLEAGADPYDHYIVATGAHGALPHHVTGDTPIDPARPLLCDFGCTVGGYHSDITRVYLPEHGCEEVREALDIVRAAHDAVIEGLATASAWRSTSRPTCGPATPSRCRPATCSPSSPASTCRAASASASRTSCTSGRTGPSCSTARRASRRSPPAPS
jgi:Xaa-Pro aminopeptidase